MIPPVAGVNKDGVPYMRSREHGRFPTVLHTIEMFVVAFKFAQKLGEASGRRDSAPAIAARALTYPQLRFIGKNAENSVERRVLSLSEPPVSVALAALTVQPRSSNVLVFNRNAKGVSLNPINIAKAHYDAMQADDNLMEVLLRHTMFLQGTVVPGKNSVFEIGVMNGTQGEDLFWLSRIKDWGQQPQTEVTFIGEVPDLQGGTRRRYDLTPDAPKKGGRK